MTNWRDTGFTVVKITFMAGILIGALREMSPEAAYEQTCKLFEWDADDKELRGICAAAVETLANNPENLKDLDFKVDLNFKVA